MTANAGALLVTIGADLSNLQSGLSSASSSLGGFGKGVALAGAAVTGAFVGAMAKGVNSAGDLQQAVANISTIKPTIDTGEVFNALNEMSTRVPQSSQALADGLYNIFSSVEVSQSEALALTEQFAQSATAAQTDVQTFGTAAMGVMNAYGMSAEEAGHISDVFFNTVAAGVVTGQELATSLGPVTQSAKAAGVSLDELGAMIVGVTKEGGPAAQNINNLNNFLQKVTTEKAQKALGDLGVATKTATGEFRPTMDVLTDLKGRLDGMTEAGKAAALQEIFPDAQARQGAATMLSQLDAVKAAYETNVSSAGAAAAAFAKMSNTFNSQMTLLGNNVEAVLTRMGAAVLPFLTPMVTALAQQIPVAADKAAAAINAAAGTIGNFASIAKTDGIAAAVGAAFDDLASSVGPKAEAAGTSLMGTFSSALAAAPGMKEAADQAASQFIDAFGAKIAGMPPIELPEVAGGGDTGGATKAIGEGLQSASGPLGEFAATFATLLPLLLAVGPALVGLNAGLSALGAIVGGVGSILAAGLLAPLTLIAAALAVLYVAWTNNWLGIQDTVSAAIPVILDLINQIPAAMEQLGATMAPIIATIGEAFNQIAATVGPVLQQIITGITDFAASAGPVIAQMAPDFAALAPLVDQLGVAFMALIQGALAQLPPILAALGPLWTAFQAVLTALAPLVPLIGAALAALAPIIGSMLTAALSTAITVLTTFVNIITALLPVAGAVVVGAINIMTAALNGLAQIIAAVIQTVSALLAGDWAGAWQGAQAIVAAVFSAIQGITSATTAAILSVISAFLTATQSLWMSIWNAILALTTSILTAISTAVQTGITTVQTAIASGMAAIQSLWDAAWNAINAAVAAAWATIQSTVSGAISAVESAVSSGMSSIQSTIASILAAIVSVFTSETAQLAGIMGGALDGVIATANGYIGAASAALSAVGAAAVQGLINGIDSMIGAARAKVAELASLVQQAASAALGIHSPSTVFHEIGMNVGQGLVNGIDSMVGAVADATGNLVGAVTGQAQDANLGMALQGAMGTQDAAAADAEQGGGGLNMLGPGLVEPMIAAWEQIVTTIMDALTAVMEFANPLLAAFQLKWQTMFTAIRTQVIQALTDIMNFLGKPWQAAWDSAAKVVQASTDHIIARVNAAAQAVLRLLQLIARLPGGTPAPQVRFNKPIGGDFGSVEGSGGRTGSSGASADLSARGQTTINVYPQEATLDPDQLVRLVDRRLSLRGAV